MHTFHSNFGTPYGPDARPGYGYEQMPQFNQPYQQPQLPMQYPEPPAYQQHGPMPMEQFAAPPQYSQAAWDYAPPYQPMTPDYGGTSPYYQPDLYPDGPGYYPVTTTHTQYEWDDFYADPPPDAWGQPTQYTSLQQQPAVPTLTTPFGMEGLYATPTQGKIRASQEVLGKTQRHKEHLLSNYSVSWVERLFRGAKEFVWDDFSKHPVMSAGFVYLGYMMFKGLKGTRAGSAVTWAAGLSLGYHFLRDKFGIRPGDKLADTVGMVSPKAEKVVRNVINTGERIVKGPEGEGSSLGYFMDKLDIKEGTNESAMLLAMTSTPVNEFFGWYDGATQGFSNKLPPTANRILNKMTLPSDLEQMSDGQRTQLMLDVSHMVFNHIGSGDRLRGEREMRSKLYTGNFVDSVNEPLKMNIQEKLQTTTSPYEQTQLRQLLVEIDGFNKGAKKQIQTASGSMTMLSAMEVEEPDVQALLAYDGIGTSFKETMAGVKHYTGKAVAATDFYGHAALDYMGAKSTEIGNYISTKLTEHNLTAADWKAWYKGEFMPWLRDAKQYGKAKLSDLGDSPVGRLVINSGRFMKTGAGTSIDMTADAVDMFADKVDQANASMVEYRNERDEARRLAQTEKQKEKGEGRA